MDQNDVKPVWWLAGAPPPHSRKGPPFPLSAVWVVVVIITWIVRRTWRWVRAA